LSKWLVFWNNYFFISRVFIALKNQLGKVAISSLLPGVGIAKQLGLSQSEIDQGISKIKNDG